MSSDPDVEPDFVMDTIEGIQGEIKEKIHSLAKVLKNLKALEAAISKEIDSMLDRRDSTRAGISRIESYMALAMQSVGDKTIEYNEFRVVLINNPSKVVVDAFAVIPTEYLSEQVQYVPNKKAIRQAILDGKNIPFASLEKSTRVSIK
jgi:hypothetical protein